MKLLTSSLGILSLQEGKWSLSSSSSRLPSSIDFILPFLRWIPFPRQLFSSSFARDLRELSTQPVLVFLCSFSVDSVFSLFFVEGRNFVLVFFAHVASRDGFLKENEEGIHRTQKTNCKIWDRKACVEWAQEKHHRKWRISLEKMSSSTKGVSSNNTKGRNEKKGSLSVQGEQMDRIHETDSISRGINLSLKTWEDERVFKL